MRRILFTTLGLLELTVAAVLVVFSFQLPTSQEVDESFGQLERVTRNTSTQVGLLRDQVHELRRPEVQAMTDRLQAQLKRVAATLRSQKIDFETVKAMSDALGDVSRGLESLATTLDAESLGKLGDGLLATANYLDEKVAPAASRAADQLDTSTGLLKDDALRLAALLRDAPLDLKAVKEIHDGLARFSEGLDKMSEALKLQRYDTMREGVKGLETSLTTGAEQVEHLAGYTYPVVTFNGVKPVVMQKPFWPEGETIGKGMRQAADGVAAAGKEMEGLAKELPKLRASLEESRKVADRSREALAMALKQQEKVEPLLKNVPQHAARLAEELPKLGTDLAKILRDTEKLKDIASQMRQAHKALEGAVSRWPELRDTVMGSAKLLKATQTQLKQVVDRRDEYEKALAETV